jgi:mono/diheme cytochrome c family protein
MWKLVMKSLFPIVAVALLVGALPNKFEPALLGADNPPASKEQVQFFKNKVRPILTQNCYPCHEDKEMGHLRVDSREGLLKGGGRGPAIVPGDPEKSLLIEAVRQTGTLKMPMGGKLDEQQIADLIAWIKMGAPWEQPEMAESKVPAGTAPADASSAGEDFFETKVRPIFANICSNCHGDAATSGLRVDSRESLLKGGSRGPAIIPNDPDKSLMIQAVRQTGELKMPKGGKLTPEEVQSLTDWVKMGAPWPRSKPTLTATRGMQFKISPEQRSFWSFQPLKLPATPAVKNGHWVRTAIDRFVLAKLESQGISPAPTADRRTLIRRATFDLTGLPPTPEEIEAFEKDRSPQAFEKVMCAAWIPRAVDICPSMVPMPIAIGSLSRSTRMFRTINLCACNWREISWMFRNPAMSSRPRLSWGAGRGCGIKPSRCKGGRTNAMNASMPFRAAYSA